MIHKRVLDDVGDVDDVDEYTHRLETLIRDALNHIATYSRHKDECALLAGPQACSCGEHSSRAAILDGVADAATLDHKNSFHEGAARKVMP